MLLSLLLLGCRDKDTGAPITDSAATDSGQTDTTGPAAPQGCADADSPALSGDLCVTCAFYWTCAF